MDCVECYRQAVKRGEGERGRGEERPTKDEHRLRSVFMMRGGDSI